MMQLERKYEFQIKTGLSMKSNLKVSKKRYNIIVSNVKLLNGMALKALPDECYTMLPDGSDLVAEEMRLRLGYNSTSTTQHSHFLQISYSFSI